MRLAIKRNVNRKCYVNLIKYKGVYILQNTQKDIPGGMWFLFKLLVGFAPLILIFIYGPYYLLFVYAMIGIIFLFILKYLKLNESNNWLVDITVSIVLWPVLLLLWKEIFKKKKRTLLDDFNSIVDGNPALKLQKEYFAAMNKDGTDEDEIPNGTGRFGLDVTNPITTNNIIGSYAYLGRLKDKHGQNISYERLGSTGAENVNHPIDMYKILDNTGKELGIIYISPYQKTISRKAPDGFMLK
jgi:hypothetical protein